MMIHQKYEAITKSIIELARNDLHTDDQKKITPCQKCKVNSAIGFFAARSSRSKSSMIRMFEDGSF